MGKRRLNILLLAGGESAEREVSMESSRAIAGALVALGHRVRVLDTLNGQYLTDHRGKFLDVPETLAARSETSIRNLGKYQNMLPSREIIKIKDEELDVVFIGLHGGQGENGGVQAVLDMLGIPYTGSPMAASAIAMNKDISKRIMQSLNIPTAEWTTMTVSSDAEKLADDILSRMSGGTWDGPPLPFIIKPADGGSTIGLSLVEDKDHIAPAVKVAAEVSSSMMVERYVSGREITISILDKEALPPVEIKPTHKLYDYTCKYTKGKSQYICPADIDEDLKERLSRDSLLFYEVIGCRGYARVDFVVAPDNSYVCLELNTLPGMTELSLLPMAAKAAGLDFSQLINRLCYLALEGN